MKWIKLTDKEPKFGEDYLLLDNNDDWFKGRLTEKKQNPQGVFFIFYNIHTQQEVDNVTHFMKITEPK